MVRMSVVVRPHEHPEALENVVLGGQIGCGRKLRSKHIGNIHSAHTCSACAFGVDKVHDLFGVPRSVECLHSD